jgi:hypothetical protein
MSSDIPKIRELEQRIFEIRDEEDFENIALEVFQFQYASNPLYRDYCNLLRRRPGVLRLEEIPFLPISFFKSHDVRSGEFQPQAVFESSGTPSSVNSRHAVKSLLLYQQSFLEGVKAF